MQEIRCPKCSEIFQVDEAGYAAIVKQVRDREFDKEVAQREENAVQLAVARAEQKKDRELSQLRSNWPCRNWKAICSMKRMIDCIRRKSSASSIKRNWPSRMSKSPSIGISRPANPPK